ncbi:MAG: serine hydrolase [Microthrixaceae bacterium]|jgi:CubicO group peptidase (beta-lactamase class C family)|nr:serine hydrolase [Microthrixaceae bacterium]
MTGFVSRRTLLAGAAATAASVAVGGCSRERETTGSTRSPGSSSETTTESTSPTPTSGPIADGRDAGYVPPAGTDGDWQTVAASSVGWTDEGLEAVARLAEETNSRALTITVGGRLLLERYFAGWTEATSGDLASVQKSVISTLVGMSVERGELNLDGAVSDILPAGWSKAGSVEADITIEHLLTMTSGLHPRRLTREAEPGTTFDYNTAAYQKLRPVLETVTGHDIDTLSRQRMFDPLGMSGGAMWEPRPDRPTNRDATGALHWGLSLPARDLARFGLLALRKGTWGDAELTTTSWFDRAWTPSAAEPSYGYLWWLVGRTVGGGVPGDWVAALGRNDQKVYVVPSLDLVVTRQGLAANEGGEARTAYDEQLMRAVLDARD